MIRGSKDKDVGQKCCHICSSLCFFHLTKQNLNVKSGGMLIKTALIAYYLLFVCFIFTCTYTHFISDTTNLWFQLPRDTINPHLGPTWLVWYQGGPGQLFPQIFILFKKENLQEVKHRQVSYMYVVAIIHLSSLPIMQQLANFQLACIIL